MNSEKLKGYIENENAMMLRVVDEVPNGISIYIKDNKRKTSEA